MIRSIILSSAEKSKSLDILSANWLPKIPPPIPPIAPPIIAPAPVPIPGRTEPIAAPVAPPSFAPAQPPARPPPARATAAPFSPSSALYISYAAKGSVKAIFALFIPPP